MDSTQVLAQVAQAKQGSSGAFGQLYEVFAQRIFKFIKLKVPHQQQAEDILQDTFMKAWKGLPRLPLDNLNFSAWLYRIARNTVNDYYRQQYRRPEPLELNEELNVATDESPAARAILDSDMKLIQHALVGLPVQYREVLELRFVQEFTVAEVAKVLGKSGLAVRLVQHRALKKLRAMTHGYI